MKLQLPKKVCSNVPLRKQLNQRFKKIISITAFCILLLAYCGMQANAQGTWAKVKTLSPDPALGVMLLLSDGSVICKSSGGGTDGIGNIWDRLVPDSKGSYINGTWSRIKPMINTRLYFSSQVLKDGRVYVSGGEYGTGGSSSEVYDPNTNTWSACPAPGGFISDANSEILEDGRVLQAIVQGNPFIRQTKLYNPASNSYAAGPSCIGGHNESTWVKLPDNSILMVDIGSRNSERYIPALNQWIADGNVPVDLYDVFGSETGAGLLLPNGKAFFMGATGHTAYYTPTGNNSPGTWVAGPDIPKNNGQVDAPAAMMVNGKILLTAAPKPTATGGVFRSPTTFYVFDYTTDTYQQISTPAGALSSNVPVYVTMMLDLPDGSVLFSYQDSSQFYVFKPTGAILPAQARPVINSIAKNTGASSYTITGKLFNGISQGANYGDDWQMNSNYPIVRLTDPANGNVYYAKSYNWNSIGVRRIGKKDTAQFVLPNGLTQKTYQLVVVANGLASPPVSFTPGLSVENKDAVEYATANKTGPMSIYPNPAIGFTNLSFSISKPTIATIKIYDASGKKVKTVFEDNIQSGRQSIKISTAGLTPGIYAVRLEAGDASENIKLVVQ